MKKVLLLLSEGFEIYEASAFIDVFGWNNIYGTKDTKLFTCGKKKHLRSTFSVLLEMERTLDKINPDDYAALAIPGGFEIYGFYNDAYSSEFSKLIKEFNKAKKPIASICVGGLSLGKSGVLANREATTYSLMGDQRVEKLTEFKASVSKSPIVIDDNIITSSSPQTAIGVAFELLKMLTGQENSDYIKEIMGFGKVNS